MYTLAKAIYNLGLLAVQLGKAVGYILYLIASALYKLTGGK
jgi:hypothetical protein